MNLWWVIVFLLMCTVDSGRDWGQEEKGTTENETAGWRHGLDGRESEWTLGVGDGQGSLAYCDSWGGKESDKTDWLNWTKLKVKVKKLLSHVWLCDTIGWLYNPWNSPGQNTAVGSLSLFQGIFPAQRSNPGLLHCRRILYQLSHRCNHAEEQVCNSSCQVKSDGSVELMTWSGKHKRHMARIWKRRIAPVKT